MLLKFLLEEVERLAPQVFLRLGETSPALPQAPSTLFSVAGVVDFCRRAIAERQCSPAAIIKHLDVLKQRILCCGACGVVLLVY